MCSETKLKFAVPTLVAHRGYSGKYPENTLLSYQKAYEKGARFMELDLQLMANQVPVLHHDVTLKRMTGTDFDIRELPSEHIKRFNASYPGRFGDEFKDNHLTTFKAFCKWLKKHPEVIVFVEFKQESIDTFGLTTFVDEVYHRATKIGVESQCVFISFNSEVVEYTRTISSLKTGWVLPSWNEDNKAILEKLNPDYAFCDKNFLPADDKDIWRGDWLWAIYNLDNIESAIAMANRNMPYLETNQIGKLMESEQLANKV